MDFSFPHFTRASTDNVVASTPQKSLLELVIEAKGRLGLVPQREAPRRHPSASTFHQFSGSDEDGDDAAGAESGAAQDAVLTTRTSWVPPSHLLDYFFSGEFLSIFLSLHGITASRAASLLAPPLLTVRDAQLHPQVEAGLCAALHETALGGPNGHLQRGGTWGAPQGGRGAAFAGGAHHSSFAGMSGFTEHERTAAGGGGGGGGGGTLSALASRSAGTARATSAEASRVLLRGLQQVSLPALLLGDHVLLSGPRGVGKRTAALLCAGANILASVHSASLPAAVSEAAAAADADAGEVDVSDATTSAALKTEEAKTERAADAAAVKEEDEEAEEVEAAAASTAPPPSSPPAPHALLLFASHSEVAATARWLECVFGPAAFAPYVFERDSVALQPLRLEPRARDAPASSSGGPVPREASRAYDAPPHWCLHSAPAAVAEGGRRFIGPPVALPFIADAAGAAGPPVLLESADPTQAESIPVGLAELAALVKEAPLPAEVPSAVPSGAAERTSAEGDGDDGAHRRRRRRRESEDEASDGGDRRRGATSSSHSHRHRSHRSRSDRDGSGAAAAGDDDGDDGDDGARVLRHRRVERAPHSGRHHHHRRRSSRERRDGAGSSSRHHRHRSSRHGRSVSDDEDDDDGSEDEERRVRRHRRHHRHRSGSGERPSRSSRHRRSDGDRDRHHHHHSRRHRSSRQERRGAASRSSSSSLSNSSVSSATSSPAQQHLFTMPPPALMPSSLDEVVAPVLDVGVEPPTVEELHALALAAMDGTSPAVVLSALPAHSFSSPAVAAPAAAVDAAAVLDGGGDAATAVDADADADADGDGAGVPSFLRQRVPLLLTTYSALQSALNAVQGEASALPPLEHVRVAVLANLERALTPPLKDSFAHAWWLSLTNAVDVECQFVVTAERLSGEVRGFLDSTILPDAGERLVHFEQRDASVWAMMNVEVCAVPVEASAGAADAAAASDAAAAAAAAVSSRGRRGGGGRPRISGGDIDAAKVARLFSAVVEHLSDEGGEAAAAAQQQQQQQQRRGGGGGGRVVVVCSARREQSTILTQLQQLFDDHVVEARAVPVRVTESAEQFRAMAAEVLVLTDAQLTDPRVLRDVHQCAAVDLIIHFSLPRPVMTQLERSEIIGVLAQRGRAVLGHSRPFCARRWWRGAHAPHSGSTDYAPVKVASLLLMTEHNMHGRAGACVMEALREVAVD
ncbi:hypothetical protein NESM_000844700 [Novymonas esmeraldas]|uniref:Uncharacterized protein n=1 Tax=Novymonas esmeraldas TaxID=1808958 RepID=A0AAW0F0P6_9TRYP